MKWLIAGVFLLTLVTLETTPLFARQYQIHQAVHSLDCVVSDVEDGGPVHRHLYPDHCWLQPEVPGAIGVDSGSQGDLAATGRDFISTLVLMVAIAAFTLYLALTQILKFYHKHDTIKVLHRKK